MPVDTPCDQYAEALPKWQRVRDCAGGRDAIHAAGEKYLPSLPGKPAGYSQYQMRANFFNAVKRTVTGLVGLIFQKPPETSDAERLKAVLADVTPRGHVPFAQFSQRVAREVWTAGRVGILVDMALDGSRPDAVMYRAEDVISWSTGTDGADEILTLVVLREEREEVDPKDRWLKVKVRRCRVLELLEGVYTQTVYEPKEAGHTEWVQVEGPIVPLRRGQALPFIPFLFAGPTGVGPDVEDPPLLDLADVNLSHYRNSADHEQGLHLVALPTPYVCGAKTSKDDPLPIGPSVVWDLEATGSAGMVEYSGAGISSIKDAMQEKKAQMATLGARVLEEQAAVAETATALRLRHSGEQATLGTVAESLEQALTQVVQWLGWWMGTEAMPAQVTATVALNKEFFSVRATPDEVRALMGLWQAEGISWPTFYQKLTRGDWTRDGVTAEEERAEIQRSIGPALAGRDDSIQEEVLDEKDIGAP